MFPKATINDREYIEIQVQLMRLPESSALKFLAEHGYKMNRVTYYEHLNKIRSKIDLRAMEIAKTGLMEMHMKAIDTLIVCERALWDSYNKLSNDPFKQSIVIDSIIKLQPYLTQAYDKTRMVMEKQAEIKSKLVIDNVK